MQENDFGIITVIVFVSLAVVALASLVVNGSAAHHYRTEAINRGYAEHDAKTGEWRWVEPKEIAE